MAQLIKKENEFVIVFNDGTEASFSMPTLTHLSMMIARGMVDPFGWVDVLVANCLQEGDKTLLSQHVGYLSQTNAMISQLYGDIECEVDWETDHAIFNLSDGNTFAVYYSNRTQSAEFRIKKDKNPVGSVKVLLKGLWIDGDQELLDSPKHIMGIFASVVEFSTRGAVLLKKK